MRGWTIESIRRYRQQCAASAEEEPKPQLSRPFGPFMSCGLPAEPVTEYVFCPYRKYRFDYAWPDYHVALEKEGGVFTRQAHGSVTGILRDIDKYNLAAQV